MTNALRKRYRPTITAARPITSRNPRRNMAPSRTSSSMVASSCWAWRPAEGRGALGRRGYGRDEHVPGRGRRLLGPAAGRERPVRVGDEVLGGVGGREGL